MAVEEVTIDLSETEISDLHIQRDGPQEVQFSVEGKTHDIDKEKIEDAMLSNVLSPASISL